MESKTEHKPIDIQEALQVALRVRTKIKKGLREIEKEISTYRGALRLAEGRLTTDASGVSPHLQGMSRPQACVFLMKGMGGQASITDLVPKLMAAGLVPTDSQKAWNKVRTALEQRLDLFVKVGSGQYALVEYFGDKLVPDESSSNGRPRKPVRDGAFAILKREGKPLYYGDILMKLQDIGIEVSGKDPRNNLLAHLSFDRRFKNIGRGLWGLEIHHRDHNPQNNDPTNLELLTKEEHRELHKHTVD